MGSCRGSFVGQCLRPKPQSIRKLRQVFAKALGQRRRRSTILHSQWGLSIALPLVQTADPSVVLAMLDVEVHDRERKDFQVGISLQIGPIYQRLPFPPHPVQVNGKVLSGAKSIFINTTEMGHSHRLDSRLLADQENQSRRLYSDLRRATNARVSFFLAFHLDGCEVEVVPTQPGVELLRSISTLTFGAAVSAGSSSFMATALKIKHKTIGETVVLLAAATEAGIRLPVLHTSSYAQRPAYEDVNRRCPG